MTGLLSLLRYAQVVYPTAPAARLVVSSAAASLPAGSRRRWWSGSCPGCPVRKIPIRA